MELFAIVFFLLGLFVGSFLGVLVDRIPKEKQVLTGRSECEFCHKKLEWYELIPLISYVLQRGKCRVCEHKLSIFYPTIEISTGVLFGVTLLFVSNQGLTAYSLLFFLFIASVLIVIFFTDLKYGIIPNKIVFPSILITFVWVITHERYLILNHLSTALFSSMFLALIAYIYYLVRKKESLGGGDIKMAFLMGLFLGFPDVVTAFYIAFLTGAAYSLILILWGRLKLKDAIPFGPFLVFGTLVTFFLGEQILSFMLPILGL